MFDLSLLQQAENATHAEKQANDPGQLALGTLLDTLRGGVIGGGIGATAGAARGITRPNRFFSHTGRGMLRGGLTGAGVMTGANLGVLPGLLLNSPGLGAIGGLIGGGLGGVAGWDATSNLIGEKPSWEESQSKPSQKKPKPPSKPKEPSKKKEPATEKTSAADRLLALLTR